MARVLKVARHHCDHHHWQLGLGSGNWTRARGRRRPVMLVVEGGAKDLRPVAAATRGTGAETLL